MSKLEASTKTFLVTNRKDRRVLGNGFARVTIHYDYMGYPISFTPIEKNYLEGQSEDHPERVREVAIQFDKEYNPKQGYSPSAK